MWVEKILHGDEQLRDWPVEGTVGYEFLNDATALFVDPVGEAVLDGLWVELSGDARPFADVALDAQREQASTTFAREVARLRALVDVPGIEDALASLGVYRTYVEPWSGQVDECDRRAVEEAGIEGRLADVLLLRERGHDEFVTRFQQTSPPVTAKGVEDTAFYRYLRLLALNEVGGDPARFSLSVDEFHAANLERARRFPRALLITQTHDTKRGGDLRARIGALAGMAGAWRERVGAWRELNAVLLEGGAPDRVEEYLIYQTLVGAWPIEPERLEAYLQKALREAKRTTSWVAPDEAYEARVKRFALGLLEHRPFLDDFQPFAAAVAREGRRSALGQTLLKLTAPGVPDVYQGDELTALNLVDPDNRRPVDWSARRAALDGLRAGTPPGADTMKLFLIWKALALRARRPECFDERGGYEALEAGPGVCAYRRGSDVLVVVGVRAWEGAVLRGAEGRWRDVLRGAELELGPRTAISEVTNADGLALLVRF